MKNKNILELNDSDYFLDSEIKNSMYIFITVIFLIICVLFIWLFFGEIDIVIKARGVLKTNEENYIIKNYITGEVISKNFEHGDKVYKGQLLWKIDTQVFEKELYNENIKFKQLNEDMQNILLYENSIINNFNNIDINERAYLSSESYFNELRKLEIEYTRAKNSYEQELNKPYELQIRVIINENKLIMQIKENELNNYKTNARILINDEKREIQNLLEETTRNIIDLEKNIEYSNVKSLSDGVIELYKNFTIGTFLFSNDEIARIVPFYENGLRVELAVETKDIAELNIGMKYYIYFDSISSSEFGKIHGFITIAPADITITSDGKSVYVLYGSINKTNVMNKNKYIVPLKPGMNTDCRIVIRRKKIISVLRKKLEIFERL